MNKISYNECVAFLEKNELVNIILLKHASFLKDSAQYFQNNTSIGITFKPEQMQHDRVLYSDYNTITILSDANDIDVYLKELDQGKYIIKVNGILPDSTFTLLQSFISLTIKQSIKPKNDYIINHEDNINSNHYKYLFGLIHYSIQDIENMINKNSAYILSIKDNDIPVCSCMIYQVYKNIWEIGALSTAENHRRKNLAENLVTYATNYIISKKQIPRYHVNMNNIPSYNLAIKCGYEPFIHFNHYYYKKN